ncbi:MAG: GntR family transcriptional regulator [Shinella sp.]|nr:GntR family transcriptional regulator [Shinella sp.]
MTNSLVSFLQAGIAEQPHGLRSAAVAQVIRQAVQQGHLSAGDALPAERVLCEIFTVSRTTLRRALDFLEAAGVIDRRPGAGNFISPGVMAPKAPLTGFTQDMESRGMAPNSKVLGSRRALVSPDESFHLGLAPGSRVLRLERLRFADQQPVSLELSVLPVEAVPVEYDGTTSLYSAMSEVGSRPVKMVQRYGATAATWEQAGHLAVSQGTPLLVIQRLGFSQTGRAVEFTRSLFRGDRFFMSSELDV